MTWGAMIDAIKAQGVPDETVGRICAQAAAQINATPAAVRDTWPATGVRPD
ncbi:hypothetical protein ACIO3O_00835 [Streptomyces sp. NPDC087440]|uniref:hypothetical protein n=1 Tax=Streptomyces sp. NPDC087440 TaxID=3365790 RepID=UPI0038133F98